MLNIYHYRLNSRGAATNEKFQVDGDKATLEVKAEINGEMYVDGVILYHLLTIVIVGFEVD